MKFIIHWVIPVIALYMSALILPENLMSIHGTSAWLSYAAMAVVFGLAKIFIRPILKVVSCGFIILTAGLFMLVINAILLWFSSWICQLIGIDSYVQFPWGALLGSIIVSAVSFAFHLFIQDRH